MRFFIKEFGCIKNIFYPVYPFKIEFIKNIMKTIKEKSSSVFKMNDYKNLIDMFNENEDLKDLEVCKLNLSNGEIEFFIPVEDSLYYKTLSRECGADIKDDFCLMSYVKENVIFGIIH